MKCAVFFCVHGKGNSGHLQQRNIISTKCVYYVCLSITNGCGSDTLCDSVNVVGVGFANIGLETVKVYPKPAENKLFTESSENLLIEMTNQLGEMLYLSPVTAKGIIFIDISKLYSGIYYLRLRNENGAYTHKIFKN